jgi:CheY-like chemotaxis protein
VARIAVVDDVAEVRDVVREVLRLAGHSVECCADRSELMDLLDRRAFDLVILDVVLGEGREFRGIEVLTELRDSPQHRFLPVLVVSADHEALREHAPELKAMPFTDVLPKPFGLTELEDAVHALQHPPESNADANPAPLI